TTGWRRGPRCVDAGLANRLYMEALGTVVAHELVRLNSKTAQIRGGLACWQRRIVTAYIEEHLADDIYIETLAKLVDLSRWYFCRAFKQSFGVPPHQYHILRRIERAKQLLMAPSPSVTDIGSALGYSDSSSFSTAFRKVTGFSPTNYHRRLD